LFSARRKRTKPAPLGVSRTKKFSLHDEEKKILGEILRVGFGMTAPINVGEDRPPINVAQMRQTRIGLAGLVGTVSLANESPASGDEMGERPGTFDGGGGSHVLSVNVTITLLKHKIPASPVSSC